MNNIKRIRDIQLTASKFLEIDPSLNISQANSDVVDFYVETAFDKSRFAVVVLDENFVTSDEMSDFHTLVVNKHQHKEINGLPIIVAVCGIDNIIKVDFFLSWDFSECHIKENLCLRILDTAQYDHLITEVRRQTHDIQVLNLENVRVIKSIALLKDRNGYDCAAELMYARKCTEDYRMNQFVPQTEQERFYHNLNGPYETEFPVDKLDESILSAVRTVYPKAIFKSRILLCTSEYRSLLRYRNYQKDYAEIRFLPDVSQIPTNILPLLGTLEGLKVNLDIYMLLRHPQNAYCNEGFELRFPFNQWMNTLSELSLGLSTFENVSKIIEM